MPKYSLEKNNTNSNLSSGFVLFPNGGEAGICLIASTELARNATRQPGGDRVHRALAQRARLEKALQNPCKRQEKARSARIGLGLAAQLHVKLNY